MNVRLLLLPAVVLLLLTGCRKDPYMQVYIDNMNAEKRMLEDTLYDLQYDYEQKVAEVDQLRDELEAMQAGGSSVLAPGSDRSGSGGGESTPRDRFPEDYNLDLPDLDIDQGTPSGPDEQDRTPPDDAGPPPLDLGEDETFSALPVPLNQDITRLYLNAAHTGGLDQDEQPGDDGIVVVFQPRNDDDEFVPSAGRVSVVLLDPETRQRVARWEISKEETEMALQKARAARGIELSMPWNDTPPAKSRLHLFVRYWLADGQAIQADREITITPSGQLAARWTPRTEQRSDPPQRLQMAEDGGRTAPLTNDPDASGAPSRWNAARSESSATGPPARQAGLPRWRPYR